MTSSVKRQPSASIVPPLPFCTAIHYHTLPTYKRAGETGLEYTAYDGLVVPAPPPQWRSDHVEK